MARAIILCLAFGLGAVQSVRLADCSCATVCRCAGRECPAPPKPTTPTHEGGGCHPGAAAPSPDSDAHKGPRCTHVETSRDLLPEDNLLSPVPPLASPAPAPILPIPEYSADTADPFIAEARGSPPLYLLHSILLI
jgi:hypothetical protein